MIWKQAAARRWSLRQLCSSLFYAYLFFRIDTDGQLVDEGNGGAEPAAGCGGQQGEQQCAPVKADNQRCRHYQPLMLNHQPDIGDEQGMGQIGKIRMFAQQVQGLAEGRGELYIGKDRKEEQGGGYGVHYAPRTQLMGGVDSLHGRVAVKKDFFVVVGQQTAQGEEKETRQSPEAGLHKGHELLAVYRQITAQQEDKEIMQHPVIEAVH